MSDSKTTKILNNLPNFLDKRGNNYQFITSFDESMQDITNQSNLLKSAIQLSTATGQYLEDIAAIFRLVRFAGETDTSLRARIKSHWEGNTRGGVKQALIDTILNNTGLSESDIVYDDSVPMIIRITATIPSFSVSSATLITILNRIKAAGVYLILLFTSSLTDSYKLYTDNVIISPSVDTSGYIIGDYWVADTASIGL
jgi:hypothetical protein